MEEEINSIGRKLLDQLNTRLAREKEIADILTKSVSEQEDYLKKISATTQTQVLNLDKLNQTLNSQLIVQQAALADLQKERATFVSDIWTEGSFLLERPTEFDEQTVSKKWKDNAENLMIEWSNEIKTIGSFTSENIETTFKDFLAKKELGIGAVLPLFRLLLTGKGMGPSMFDISAFLGKEECLERISIGISSLQKV